MCMCVCVCVCVCTRGRRGMIVRRLSDVTLPLLAASNRATWLGLLEAETAAAPASADVSEAASQVKAMRRRTTAFNDVLMPVAAAASAAHNKLEASQDDDSVWKGLNALQTFVLAQGEPFRARCRCLSVSHRVSRPIACAEDEASIDDVEIIENE